MQLLSQLVSNLDSSTIQVATLLLGILFIYWFFRDVIITDYRIKLYHKCGSKSHTIFVISSCVYLISGMNLVSSSLIGLIKKSPLDQNSVVVWSLIALFSLVLRVKESDKLDSVESTT
jgi:hypothetical protein